MYKNLLKAIKIPSVIITDLDILRSEDEKKNFTKICSLKDRETTNKTIEKFSGNKSIENVSFPIVDGNIYVFSQDCYKGLYRTSFEEAFVAVNADNEIVNSILKELKPRIYKEIVGDKKNLNYTNNEVEA